MRTLVIGGTVFLGRAVVEAALARGDDVTYFHRGRHGRGLHPGAREVLGDRADGVPDGEFDAVVDTCGFDPEAVGVSARSLADRAAHYTFVSSASAYRDWPTRAVDEDSRVFQGDEPEYGPRKAAAERAAEAAMPGRVLHVRAGLIVGPHENIGRLPRWLRRMEQGGDVLAPGRADAGVQWIDARDLAEWMLAMGARRQAGVFNAVAPPGWTTWGAVLEACRDAVNPAAALAWVDGAQVAAALEEPWTQLPIWPAPQPDMAHVYGVDTHRATAAGLRIRPLAETVADTWAWLRDGGELSGWRDELRGEGLEAARERALLAELMS
jgi:nucleoside-diphosphate-sugar epimerase